MRETSLDEFLGEGDADPGPSEADDDADSAGADPSTADEPRADAGEAASEGTDAVEPAVPTYDWTPAGAACEACDAVVERRWRDDAGLVCADCKTW